MNNEALSLLQRKPIRTHSFPIALAISPGQKRIALGLRMQKVLLSRALLRFRMLFMLMRES